MARVRRVLAGLAAFGLATGGFVLGATAAHAAASITDNGNGSFTVAGVTGGGLDYLYLCPSNLTAAACWNSANPTGRAEYSVQGPIASTTFTVGSAVKTYPGNVTTALPAGTYRAITNNGPSLDASALVTVYAATGSEIAGAALPGPIVQQFGKPASGTCDSTQLSGLDWSGVTSGGWSESWAQWVNGGAGGAVCTRSLVYSGSLARWVVE